ncbi:secreted RxLR effector protein 161-like [Elaeis guineensis]|uniref:secreted RxLR effector protein 161-like n=1 Tax=Elaeis guineensis var. tenera TaxID=51953 RepID=UPI003C6D25A3
MTDLDLLHYFLGFEIKQSEEEIFVSQEKYAKDLLKRFEMLDCKKTATPMNINEKLRFEDGTKMTHTRPDIAFSVGVVFKYMHNPTKHHFGAAKRISRYIVGTMNYGIWYSHIINFNLFEFSDSDWAGFVGDRRSTSGNVFTLGSGAISWSSKKQAITALSSFEAEYVVAASSVCQALWLEGYLNIIVNLKKKLLI